LKGGEVKPDTAMKIMLYTYCHTFKINPMEAYETPISVVIDMLSIHGEFKKLESEELEKQLK
tara:strand:- start:1054 stop:1239 length:186 start_codon:yes stop_codon:yes gene_type:complete